MGQLVIGALCVVALFGTFWTGRALDFETVVYLRNYSVPVAISWLYHGGSGYTAFRDVVSVIQDQGLSEASIQEAAHVSTIDRNDVLYIPADDKGRVDLAVFSFVLFGPHLYSMYLGFFVLLGVSAACFILQFRGEPNALAVLAIYLLSLWATTPVLAITKELYSFTNPRVFGVLTILPVLHMVFSIGRPLPRAGLILCMIQAFLLVECVHMRSTDVWAFIAIATVGAATFAYRGRLPSMWPVGIAFFCLALLPIYQRLAYDPAYFTEKGAGHIFWHNVAMGFGLDPYFTQKYGVTMMDSSVRNLVIGKSTELGGPELTTKIFGTPGTIYPDVADDLALYDQVAKLVTLRMARENPAETLKLFLVYKPQLLGRTLLWAAGVYPQDLQRLAISDQAPSITSVDERAREGIYLQPWSLFPLIGLVLLALTRTKVKLPSMGIVMFAASLIAPIVVYPAIQTLAVPMLLLTMLCQIGTLWILGKLLGVAFSFAESHSIGPFNQGIGPVDTLHPVGELLPDSVDSGIERSSSM